MKKLFSLILVLSLSLSNISFSYAWPFGLFEKKTEEKKSSSSLGELVEEYAKKVKVNINLPKKNEQDKYANYISYATIELSKQLKKKKADVDLVYFNYANVIYEKELPHEDVKKLKDKDIIAEYLVCFVYTYADKNKDIKTEVSNILCQITFDEYIKMVKKRMETDNTYYSDRNDLYATAKGAVGGALAGAGLGSVVPVIGTAIGAAGGAVIGGIGSFFESMVGGGAREKADLIKAISEFPDKVYEESFTEISAGLNPKIKIVKLIDLENYLDANQLKAFNSGIKNFSVNE